MNVNTWEWVLHIIRNQGYARIGETWFFMMEEKLVRISLNYNNRIFEADFIELDGLKIHFEKEISIPTRRFPEIYRLLEPHMMADLL